MQTHEFFDKYANTPMDKRFVILDFNKTGTMTLHDVYERIKIAEDIMRPHRIEVDDLLDRVEKYLSN